MAKILQNHQLNNSTNTIKLLLHPQNHHKPQKTLQIPQQTSPKSQFAREPLLGRAVRPSWLLQGVAGKKVLCVEVDGTERHVAWMQPEVIDGHGSKLNHR
jgi:hypothetical protein